MIQTIFDLIDTRAFSSLWYWVVVAGVWSVVSRRVLGVPVELVIRARHQPEAAALLRGLLPPPARPGAVRVVIVSCLLTVLVMLGFVHGVELAQAVSLIVLPLAGVWLLDLRAAHRAAGVTEAEPLVRLLLGHHFLVQFIGFAAIGIAALYGMLQVLRAHYLGV